MKAITHNLDSEWLPHNRQSREASSRRPRKMSTYLWSVSFKMSRYGGLSAKRVFCYIAKTVNQNRFAE